MAADRFLSRVEHAISEPTVIPRSEHPISRENISPGALKVLYTLKNAGYEGYLVGGGVRDLLLGQEPKDFDVVTDADPDQIKALFRSCRLIGRRFRLAHVRVGREIIEVATFRGAGSEEEEEHPERVSVNGRLVRDNVYGTSLEEDVWRRDFTVNGLYYDIRDFSLIDYTGGMKDLESRTLRIIGDARTRFREDPVRVLRAIRFAAKLGFRLDSEIERAIDEAAPLLEDIPPARLYEEVLKLLLSGAAVASYELLRRYELFEYLFPETDASLDEDPHGPVGALVRQALASTDQRVAEDKPVTPAFLFAALLWEPVQRDAVAFRTQGMSEILAMDTAGADALARQSEHVALPRRFALVTREIWSFQARLERARGRKVNGIIERQRFRAAYDFLVLRAAAGEERVKESAEWWTRHLDGAGAVVAAAAAAGPSAPSDDEDPGPGSEAGEGSGNGETEGGDRPRSRRRRRRRRRPRSGSSAQAG